MRNRATLTMIVGLALLNGLDLESIPPWRQLGFVVLSVAAYLHGRHLPVRRPWVLIGVFAAAGAGYAILDFWNGVGALMVLALSVVLPWLAGSFRRQQAQLVQAGRDRVAQLEREQELIAERATYRERARIASDLHDSLGHDLALIALRAGALELAADLGQPHRDAAAALRTSAVTATDRLRRTVGVLREGGTNPTLPPDESVGTLVERARSAGMAVRLHQPGQPPVTPAATDGAVHRVVREALTNAARHAPGADVLVSIERTHDTVTVAVTNSAPPTTPVPAGVAGGGSGIAGLRERVQVLGGTLRAGPRDGGFAVTARIPCAGSGGVGDGNTSGYGGDGRVGTGDGRVGTGSGGEGNG